jgi:hypothetical protein
VLGVDGTDLRAVRSDRAGIFLLGDRKRYWRFWFPTSDTDAPWQRMRPLVFVCGYAPFGSQTQVMYRSALVRRQEAFYNVSFPFADVEKCIGILEHWDFGFVYQVLSFSRIDNESVLHQAVLPMAAYPLAQYIIAQRYAPVFMEAGEVASIIAKYKLQYYRALARAALRFRGRAFWRFHKVGLQALGQHEKHDWLYLAMITGAELLWLASNPGMTTLEVFRRLRQQIGSKRATPSPGSLPADFVCPRGE